MKTKNIRIRISCMAALVFCLTLPMLFSGCSKDNTIYVDAATLTLSQYETITIAPEGGSVEISVNTNQEQWTATSDQPWCVVTPESGKFKITAAESPSTQEQPAATITITAGPEYNLASEKLTVRQTALMPATVSIDPQESIAFPAKGGTRQVSVETNQALWEVACAQEWCKVAKNDGGFVITVTANTSPESREKAEVIVKAGPAKNQSIVSLSVHQDGKPVIEGINLSENGTANSYIVSEAGEFYFSATMMGNNAATPGISPKSLAPVKAALLWQDYFSQNEGLVKTVSMQNGYVTFSTYDNYHLGNAVIAVMDAQNKIIWSWHLWFTDDVRDMNVADLTNGGQLLYTLMDRNLGAVSSTPGNDRSLGLYYQWGRKDPFVSAAGKGYNSRTMEAEAFVGSNVTTQSATAFTYDIQGNVNNSTKNDNVWKIGAADVVVDVDVAVANPTVFYSKKPTTNDWITVQNAGLWGNPWEGDAVYPAYSTTKCNSGKGSKSIYDPCPPGYRVIPMDTWIRAGVKIGTAQIAYDTQSYGYNLNILIFGGSLWFPLAGSRDQTSGVQSSAGSAGFCWTSSTSGATAKTSSTVSSSSGSFSTSAGINRAWGYPVRCCKE